MASSFPISPQHANHCSSGSRLGSPKVCLPPRFALRSVSLHHTNAYGKSVFLKACLLTVNGLIAKPPQMYSLTSMGPSVVALVGAAKAGWWAREHLTGSAVGVPKGLNGRGENG